MCSSVKPYDVEIFQQAKQLANSGQKQAAYNQFCALYNNGNDNDPDLLLWIAFTTPHQSEAQRALDTVSHIAPGHPDLFQARAYQTQQQQQYMQPPYQQYIPLGPALHCPYCHTYAPVRIERKISTAGWVIFGVLLFFTLIFCWIGLLIKEDYRVCSNCGSKLG
jgi:hypothetical protein